MDCKAPIRGKSYKSNIKVIALWPLFVVKGWRGFCGFDSDFENFRLTWSKESQHVWLGQKLLSNGVLCENGNGWWAKSINRLIARNGRWWNVMEEKWRAKCGVIARTVKWFVNKYVWCVVREIGFERMSFGLCVEKEKCGVSAQSNDSWIMMWDAWCAN